MYDRLIYSEREIKAEEIVAVLKKAYPEVVTWPVGKDNSFPFETKDNHGFFISKITGKTEARRIMELLWRTSAKKSPILKTRKTSPVSK